MEIVNYKTILDKTFMLLDQAISEKKEEKSVQKMSDKYLKYNKEFSREVSKPGKYKG